MQNHDLKTFFDMCAEESDGCVFAERIIELARQESPPDNKEIVAVFENVFEPFGTNPISFEEFCEAIRSIAVQGSEVHADSLVKRMSVCYQETAHSDDDHSKDPTMDDSSITFNEYDLSAPVDGDNRESILSGPTVSDVFDKPRKYHNIDSFHKYNGYAAIHEDVVYDLEDRVDSLKAQICGISQEKASQDDMLKRLQHENKQLRNRLLIIEDRIEDVEQTTSSNRNALTNESTHVHLRKIRNEDDQANDAFILNRIEKLEEELAKSRRTYSDMRKLEDTISSLRSRLEEVESHEVFRNFNESFTAFKNESAKPAKMIVTNPTEAANAQQNLLELQTSMSDNMSTGSRSMHQSVISDKSLTDFVADLHDQVVALTEENLRLKEQNAQLKKNLDEINLQGEWVPGDIPLSTELELLSKQELQTKVEELVFENIRYRHYVDNINKRILEECPDLLEKSAGKC